MSTNTPSTPRNRSDDTVPFIIIGIIISLIVLFGVLVVVYLMKKKPRYPFLTKRRPDIETNHYGTVPAIGKSGDDSAGTGRSSSPQEPIYDTVGSAVPTPVLNEHNMQNQPQRPRTLNIATIEVSLPTSVTSSRPLSPIQQLSLPPIPTRGAELENTRNDIENGYDNLRLTEIPYGELTQMTSSFQTSTTVGPRTNVRVSRSLEASPCTARGRHLTAAKNRSRIATFSKSLNNLTLFHER